MAGAGENDDDEDDVVVVVVRVVEESLDDVTVVGVVEGEVEVRVTVVGAMAEASLEVKITTDVTAAVVAGAVDVEGAGADDDASELDPIDDEPGDAAEVNRELLDGLALLEAEVPERDDGRPPLEEGVETDAIINIIRLASRFWPEGLSISGRARTGGVGHGDNDIDGDLTGRGGASPARINRE